MPELSSHRSLSQSAPASGSICQPTSPRDLFPPDIVRAELLPRVVAVLKQDRRLEPAAAELSANGERISFVSTSEMQSVLGMTGLAQFDQRGDRVLVDKARIDHIAKQLIREAEGACTDRKLYDDLASILTPAVAHEMRHRIDYRRIGESIGAGQSGLYVREAEASALKDEFIAASLLGERFKQLAASTTFDDHGALKLLESRVQRREPSEVALAEADRLYAFKPKVSATGSSRDAGTIDAMFRERYDALRERLSSERLAAYEWMKSPTQIAQIRAYFDERLK